MENLTCDESPAEAAVEAGDFNLVEIALDPVKVLADPVDRQALGRRQAGLDHHLDVAKGAPHQGSTVDFVVYHIGPEHLEGIPCCASVYVHLCNAWKADRGVESVYMHLCTYM